MVKNLPAMQETQVPSLGRDPVFLPRVFNGQFGGLCSMGLQRVGHS